MQENEKAAKQQEIRIIKKINTEVFIYMYTNKYCYKKKIHLKKKYACKQPTLKYTSLSLIYFMLLIMIQNSNDFDEKSNT